MKKVNYNLGVFQIIILSVVNLLIMHYTIFFTCNVERQIDFTVFFDNFTFVIFEVLLLYCTFYLFFKKNAALAAFVCSFITMIWAFCNVIYSRYFNQYISVSAITEGTNLFDPFVLKCLVDGFRWYDLLYLGSFVLSYYLYSNIPHYKFHMSDLKCMTFVFFFLLFVDICSHIVFCLSSPNMRYLSYVRHRLSLELFSQKCYSGQPVYSNFQRGSLRPLTYGVIEHFSGKMELNNSQRDKIEEMISSLKKEQRCSNNHPDIRNLIFIIVESYMSFVVDMKVNGKEITPFLNSLYKDSSVYYNGNVYPNITLGESSDGQFLYMTGLLPLRSEITVTKAKSDPYPALPRLLANAKQMHTQMVIPTAPSMWSQDIMCERYGIEDLYSTSDYRKPHYTYLSDEQVILLTDSVNGVSDQPFFSIVLTFSMHQPYVNEIDSSFIVLDESCSSSLKNYLNACHYTDAQLFRYFNMLKQRRLYENSLIVIVSDHHVGNSALELPDSIDRKLPLFIINGGVDTRNAWKGDCNQLDIFTTIIDLLGIETSWRGLGHSLLSPLYKNSLTNEKWDYSEWIIKSGYLNRYIIQ